MSKGTIIRVAIVGAALLATASCGPSREDPDQVVVAEIDGRALTLAEFLAYIDANFPHEAFEEPLSATDAARVRSRLFDDFVNEALLLTEAESRGLRAEPAEIDAWLSGGGAGPAPDAAHEKAQRDRAGREVVVQKLLEAELVTPPDSGTTSPESRAEPVPQTPMTEPESASTGGLLERLRATRNVTLHTESLPFAYVPDSPRATGEEGS